MVPDKLRSLLKAPTFEDDEKTRKAHLLHVILVALLSIAGIYLFMGPLIDPDPHAGMILNGVTVIVYLLAMWLLRRGQVRAAGTMFSFTFWVLVSLVAVAYGRILSPALISYFTTIVIAGLLLGGWAAIAFAAMSILASATILVGEANQLLPVQLLAASSPSMWWISSVNFVMVANLLYLADRSIVDALSRARQNEEDLAESARALQHQIEERYHVVEQLRFQAQLLDSVREAVVSTDASGRVNYWGKGAETLYGYKASEVMGELIASIIVPGDEAADRERIREVREHGQWRGQFWQTRRDGTRFIADALISLVRDAEGQPVGFVGIDRDISEQREAQIARERLLNEVQQRVKELSVLLESARVVSSTMALEDVLQSIAMNITQTLGVDSCTLSRWDRPTDSVVTWIEHRRQGTADPDPVGTTYALADYPATRNVLESQQPLAITRDDPAADPAEVALLEVHDDMSLLMLPMSVGSEVLGLAELFQGVRARSFSPDETRLAQALVNQAAIAIKKARLFQETQEQAQQLQRILDAVQEGIVLLDQDSRVSLANPPGRLYLKLLAGIDKGEELSQLGDLAMAPFLTARAESQIRQEIALPDGAYFEVTITRLEAGTEIGGWVLILRDMTEVRKRAEAQQTQQRLATVGQLAAGVAHDFNNIMAVIMLYTQLILKRADLTEQDRNSLGTVQEQAERAANLTTQILDFSRRSVMARKTIEFQSFLHDLVRLMKRTLPESIAIDLTSTDEPLVVQADPTRLQQAVMNLSLNARDAMPDGGEIRLELSGLDLDPAQCEPPLPEMPAGRWLRLRISDTGSGIEPASLPHVFEPFFTTKSPGRGTGLGLAQVYGIIRQHDGYVEVSSRVDQGTTFTFYLPLVQAPDTQLQEQLEVPMSVVPGQGEIVLVVEDETDTRTAVCDTLTAIGYRTWAAADGDEALALVEEHGRDIDLVLSDLVMPRMGGEALFSALQERGSRIPMVVMTGYPLAEKGQELLEKGIVAWLAKPFAADEIAIIIRQAMATRAVAQSPQISGDGVA